ncbi:DUF6343 family protein [Streptomyces sp. NPDC057702]|uniref:DUF6343 family protein n=1 Tax=unclassified Streptomyces TaxID=2593676 RepID=UPI0036BD0E8E
MPRTGDEPLHARSPLRLRLGLALWGLVWSLAGAIAFAVAGRPGWAAACAAVAAVTLLDIGFVVRHLRQGPHYQPARDVPPYEPVSGESPEPGERRRDGGRRHRPPRY